MTGEIAERLRDLADKLEEPDEDLPMFNGFRMRKRLYSSSVVTVYEDLDGDVWVEDENGDGAAAIDGKAREAIEDAWYDE